MYQNTHTHTLFTMFLTHILINTNTYIESEKRGHVDSAGVNDKEWTLMNQIR